MSTRASATPALPLFVYGTLRSGERAAHLLEAEAVRRASATVRGRLVDTGQAYPGAVFEHTGGVIEGELVWVRPERYASTLARLDAYEGAPTLFRRVAVVGEAGGEAVEAYAYEWQGDGVRVCRG